MEFTKEMRGTHTLYLPAMLDQHFPLIRHALRGEGYQVRVLSVEPEEEKCPRNCACYPVSRMVGQMLTALETGVCENPRRSAFLLPPAGAGCAGENHFRPIEMALEDAGFPEVPVLALNLREKQVFPGISLTPGLIRKALSAILLGDMLQLCLMDAAPDEAEPGSAEALHRKWVHDLGPQIASGKTCSGSHRRACYMEILKSFKALPRSGRPAVKVVMTGEPYLKYCAAGNRDLLRTLWAHGCKVWLSGFVGYGTCVVDSLRDQFEHNGNRALKNLCGMARDYAGKLQREMLDLAEKAGLDHPSHYDEVKARADAALGSCRVDDAWYLAADILDAGAAGYRTVVVPCAAGCLGPERIAREVLAKVNEHRPELEVTLLDFTAPPEERAQVLDGLLARIEEQRADEAVSSGAFV